MRSRGKLALGATVAVLSYVVVRGRVRRYEIVERSMEPTLRPGDYIVAQRLDAAPRRGDIVIFGHPEVPGFDLVKRVIGNPGEQMVIGNGQVHADGATLAEPWADGPTRPDGSWDLGDDEVFVLGDNRAASSADSRTLGPVAATSIRWKVVARYWPPGEAGKIGI